jgi:hypothetical protein
MVYGQLPGQGLWGASIMKHVLEAISEREEFNLGPWRCYRAHVGGGVMPVLGSANGLRGSQTCGGGLRNTSGGG